MTSAITAPLNFWDNKFWHHEVHLRLGEALYYYLVRVRPFDSDDVRDRLKKLLSEQQLGSVRVFPIFGTYDLIIRAWLHPNVATRFRAELDAILAVAGSGHAVHTFMVERIDKRWHDQQGVDRSLLESLDEYAIRDVQRGERLDLLRRLIDGKLVLTRRRTQNISFFTTINIEAITDALPAGVVNAIRQYLLDRPRVIENVSIYRGSGYCSILVKGEVGNYFNIAPLPNWIGSTYRDFRVHTETYLVHEASHILGDEVVGEATFDALQGRDLFVQAIIPELYNKIIGQLKRGAVERLLNEAALTLALTDKDKKVLHDYLLAYLNDDKTGMAKTMFTLFFELETYLRERHKEFVGRKTKGGTVGEMYDKIHTPEAERENPTLKTFLHLYSQTIKVTDEANEFGDLVGGEWDNLAKLRNDIVHGNVDPLQNWDSLMKRLLPSLPRIRRLLLLIESVTGKAYNGDYI